MHPGTSIRAAILIAVLVVVSAAAWAGERRQTKPYGTSAHDTAGLLDQINRDHGAPKAKYTPRARSRSGGYEYNPLRPAQIPPRLARHDRCHQPRLPAGLPAPASLNRKSRKTSTPVPPHVTPAVKRGSCGRVRKSAGFFTFPPLPGSLTKVHSYDMLQIGIIPISTLPSRKEIPHGHLCLPGLRLRI